MSKQCIDPHSFLQQTLKELESDMPRPCPSQGLVGSRIFLGAMHPKYTNPLWYLINDHHNGLGRRGPIGYEAEHEWVRRQSSREGVISLTDKGYIYAVFEPNNNVPIGTIGLFKKELALPDHTKQSQWHTGTFIGAPWQGLGYGTEAKMLLLQWISLNFTQEEIPEIWSTVYEFNLASLCVQQKCGYKIIPQTSPESHTRNGIQYNEVVLKMAPGINWLKEHWNPFAAKTGLQAWDPGLLEPKVS